MSDDITDMEPCTKDEGKLFMSATGMVDWLSATGRPDSRVYHLHVSQHMAAPVKGGLKAVMRIACYLTRITRSYAYSSRGAMPIPTKAHARIRQTSGAADSVSWQLSSGLL